jgi:hypothetical protein
LIAPGPVRSQPRPALTLDDVTTDRCLIDIEHDALRAFEQDAATEADGLI